MLYIRTRRSGHTHWPFGPTPTPVTTRVGADTKKARPPGLSRPGQNLARILAVPDRSRPFVGPGTLDQELQEPKGLHQNQITSKKPPDSKGNQEAEMAAAKGLLPHEDHRRTKS